MAIRKCEMLASVIFFYPADYHYILKSSCGIVLYFSAPPVGIVLGFSTLSAIFHYVLARFLRYYTLGRILIFTTYRYLFAESLNSPLTAPPGRSMRIFSSPVLVRMETTPLPSPRARYWPSLVQEQQFTRAATCIQQRLCCTFRLYRYSIRLFFELQLDNRR